MYLSGGQETGNLFKVALCLCTYIKFLGILAGMRPCGVILFVSELFIPESLSQVYGCLPNYYTLYPNAVQDIGKNATLWIYIATIYIVRMYSMFP